MNSKCSIGTYYIITSWIPGTSILTKINTKCVQLTNVPTHMILIVCNEAVVLMRLLYRCIVWQENYEYRSR